MTILKNLFGAIALDSTLQDVRDAAQSMRDAAGGMRAISAARGILADLRVTVINALNVGTVTSVTGVTTVATVTTVTTTTTVGTLTNQSQIGGLNAAPYMQMLTNNNAANSNLANVVRS
jgi:hypothetical protein